MKRNYTFLLLMLLALAPAGIKAQSGCDITLPWSQDFEGLAAGGNSFVPCWTRVDSCSNGSAVYPNVYAYGSTHGNVLNFMGNGMSASGTMRAATPRIPAPLNALELSFVVYKNTLNLYAATNPSDLTTYTLIGSYAPGYVWTTYEVRTDTVAGVAADTGYLVFTCPFGSGYSNGNPYLDDLYVTALNPCQRTLEVVAERVGTTTAILTWPEVTGATAYYVCYDTDASMSDPTCLEVSSGTITLTDLDTNTHYYVNVYTVCGDGNMSDPRPVEFTTERSCYSIVNLRQVSVCSEAAAFQWDYDMRGNSADGVITVLRDLTDPTVGDIEEPSTGSNYHFFTALDNTHDYLAIFRTLCGADTADAVSVHIAFRHCGESDLAADSTSWVNDHPLVTFYNYGYSQMMYPASVLYDMDTIRGLALRRLVRPSSTATTRTLSIWLGHSSASTTASPQSVTGMVQVASDVSYTLENQEWDTLMFTTPFAYDGTSNVVVTLCDNTGTHTGMGATPYWLCHDAEWAMYFKSNDDNPYNAAAPTFSVQQQMHLPDLRFVGGCDVDEVCEAPVVAVVSVDTTSVSVEWAAGSGTSWTLQYRTVGGSWSSVTGITDMLYTLGGLTPDTRYELRVGVDCNGQMRYSLAVPFMTECAMLHIPFHFTQNDLVSTVDGGGFSSCWSFSDYTYRGKLTFSHRAYVRNAGNGQWIMLPAVAEHLSGARLRTWAAVSSHSLVRVGIASQSDCSDVVWMDTISLPGTDPNTNTSEYIAYFDGYEGHGNRVVLSPVVDNEFSFVYFFDFHIEYAEGCRPVVGLTLDSADANSLSFHWTPVGTATQWLVYVDGVEHGMANSPSYTVTGLDPYTEYDIAVRTYCGDDSSYATEATFLTGCEGVSCSFTVNGASSTHNGWNGGFMEIVSGSRVIGTVRMNSGSTVSRSFFLCGGMPLTFNWYSGNADEVCSFVIVDEEGEVLCQHSTAENLGQAFFALDSLCGIEDDPGPGPGPGPGPEPGGIDGVSGTLLTLSPNPASGLVTLSGVAAGATVTLRDLCGRQVMAVVHEGDGTFTFDAGRLPRGTYFVHVVGDDSAATVKLIVQ